jgi:hypothetical protein
MLRGGLDWGLRRLELAADVAGFLVCTLPWGNSLLWWSPWLVVCSLLFGVWAIPSGWAYFLVSGRRSGQSGPHPIWGAILVLVVSLAGAIRYAGGDQPMRLAICQGLAVLSALALGWLIAGYTKAARAAQSDALGVARNLLSRWLTTGLVAAAALIAWTLLDSLAGTIYAVWVDGESALGHWAAALLAAVAGIGAFARQIAMLIGSRRASARPGVMLSTATWTAAGIVVSLWLLAVATTSYAVVWRLEPLRSKPPAIGSAPPPTILGVERVLVAPDRGGFVVSAAPARPEVCGPVLLLEQDPNWAYVGTAFVALLLLSGLFGQTRTFANMSSMHAFYAARLTRTFLGASNEARMRERVPVTETIAGDDLDAGHYWRWPVVGAATTTGAEPAYPWRRGGPLHIVNVTVNETLDAVTGVQHQDRKGTGLAVGPSALSLGIRHHLVRSNSPLQVFPRTDAGSGVHVHRVFADAETTPEALPLGRWVSISGAAFSTAAGAQTTVPMALLAGMFNVRLGYWWDSGMPARRRSRLGRIFPVQYALLSEALARTRGTADRLWNLSDGGHFENMGGYELVRRRLPIVVIVDAEADPDYTFEGLSELVRKSRLDFDAEVSFYTEPQLSGTIPVESGPVVPVLPARVRPFFGGLDNLRRGRWTEESLPRGSGDATSRHTIEVDRSRVSRANAALARVEYQDNGDASWLVYVKATLIGEEPEDVCHYHRAHPEFPQEPTSDQFFDEAQWESYRRLGQHIGRRVLPPELFEHLRAHPAPRGKGRAQRAQERSSS